MPTLALNPALIRFKRVLLATITVLISTIIGLIIVELIGDMLVKNEETTHHGWRRGWMDRFTFYSGSVDSTIIKNIQTFFLFEPEARIRQVAYFLVNGAWVKEYDYHFNTNKLGLVQSTELDLEKESILLLGDSFTQGLGASPWVDELSKQVTNDKYQLVDGGIFGTGFAQWYLLDQYLSQNGVKIRSLAVIFISDDYTRPVWNFADHSLSCLKESKLCDGRETFFRLPDDSNITKLITKYYKQRQKKHDSTFSGILTQFFAKYLSTTKRSIDAFMTEYDSDEAAAKLNNNAIGDLIDTYKNNVIFVHIPQREEISNGISSFGLRARDEINSRGGNIYDGFKSCGLTIQDYYVHDEHPNPKGYDKISKCVYRALSERHWVE